MCSAGLPPESSRQEYFSSEPKEIKCKPAVYESEY